MNLNLSSWAETKNLAEFTVGVDNVIFSVDTAKSRLLVLLIKRPDQPEQGKWSLPGTLVRRGETLEAAAHRILAEKIRVKNLYLEQLYSFGESHHARTEERRYLSVSYFALVRFEDAILLAEPKAPSSNSASRNSISPSDSASDVIATIDPAFDRLEKAPTVANTDEAKVETETATLMTTDTPPASQEKRTAWFSVETPPQLAFNHQEILDYGYQRLRNKLEYSPIAFDVLPEVFSLNDLYQFYATVLGDNFSDYSNFRSRLLKLGFLVDTGLKTARGAGRPASLYRFDQAAFAPFKNKPLVFV